MAHQETPLDERQWRSPAALTNLQYFGGLHSKTVHLYFMESDFFDRTSNNWALFMQHKGEPWLTDRDQFEARLRAMQGLEFMVVAEAERRPDGTDTGVYVFRKQQRRKRAGHEDEITILGTYYLAGENLYQAASLEDIIGNRILAAQTSLNKFFEIASRLPIYSSERGYTYYSQPASTRPVATSVNTTPRITPPGSPGAEASAAQAAASSQTQSDSGRQQPAKARDTDSAAMATSVRALTQSMQLFRSYADEFMDTNPLVGEPGSFVFSSTARRVQQNQAKQAEEAAAAAAAKASSNVAADGPKTDSKPGTPALAASPDLPSASAGAGAVGNKKPPKIKRSKSRAGTAPTSPVTPTTGATPGKGL